jgi:hypothetical protein
VTVKLISALFKAVLGIISKLFGSFSWSPPPWFDFFRNFFSNIKSLIKRPRLQDSETRFAVKKSRKINFKRLGAALAIVVIIFALVMWYAAHRRGLIQVSGTVPELTKLEDVLKPDPIRVLFSGSAARLDSIGKTVTKGVSISPPIEGEWTWAKDNALLFKPKADWLSGTEYTIRMDKSLFPDHVKLSTHSYSFQTPRFAAELTNAEFYQDHDDPNIKRVIATIKFTHPVNSIDFEKRIKLERADQKTGILGIGGKGYPLPCPMTSTRVRHTSNRSPWRSLKRTHQCLSPSTQGYVPSVADRLLLSPLRDR